MTPLITLDRLLPTTAGWLFLVTFLFEGYVFDYDFIVGATSMTEEQAKDTVTRQKLLWNARRTFLRDVQLETRH